jgi:hypothetical protein
VFREVVVNQFSLIIVRMRKSRKATRRGGNANSVALNNNYINKGKRFGTRLNIGNIPRTINTRRYKARPVNYGAIRRNILSGPAMVGYVTNAPGVGKKQVATKVVGTSSPNVMSLIGSNTKTVMSNNSRSRTASNFESNAYIGINNRMSRRLSNFNANNRMSFGPQTTRRPYSY